MPGIRTSTMRHEVSCSWPEVRNISADSKAAARKPKDSIRRVVVLRMDSSSSMTEIKFFPTMDPPLDPSYLQMHKESIVHWWILRGPWSYGARMFGKVSKLGARQRYSLREQARVSRPFERGEATIPLSFSA